VTASSKFSTDQEAFWAGQFGNDYIGRNASEQLLASNLNFFSQALRRAGRIQSCIEFGANIGMNLRALRLLQPQMSLFGVEINETAAAQLGEFLGKDRVYCGSIFDFPAPAPVQLSFIKGVLIHINPDKLALTYQKLYEASSQYVLVAEYYNPSPTAIPYRGHTDRLFKRDFAGEMLDKYPDLKLIDYGFAYRRDPAYPQDDITWFLMEKKG
jgi:pseudaminic acid biosynthesis-associated methylase